MLKSYVNIILLSYLSQKKMEGGSCIEHRSSIDLSTTTSKLTSSLEDALVDKIWFQDLLEITCVGFHSSHIMVTCMRIQVTRNLDRCACGMRIVVIMQGTWSLIKLFHVFIAFPADQMSLYSPCNYDTASLFVGWEDKKIRKLTAAEMV